MTTDRSLRGRLLVATPALLDPNFFRTVVLVLEDGPDGTLGVVLNRATAEPVSAHVPAWGGLVGEPGWVFVGGPVQNDIAVALVENPQPQPEGWSAAIGDVGLLDLSLGPDYFTTVSRLRIFSGYAGWDFGQLQVELDESSWFVLEADPDDVFSADADGLWRQVLARQPFAVSMYARYPDDPSLN